MKAIGWIALVAVLFAWTFTLSFCILCFASATVFLIGGTTYVYVQEESVETDWSKLTQYSFVAKPLRAVCELMKKRKRKYNFDNRLTGSHIIDEELQLILYYVFRDFVYPWYNKISNDQEFPYQLKETAQKIVTALANRIKEVAWVPFVTTKVVDDFASHLRLYKQARAKVKSTGQGNLELYFFDLEFTMENSLLCRDHICLNAKEEKFYVQHIADALLCRLLPQSDFDCKTLRYLSREILTEVILLPLFTMISDPDYVNQTILWLCNDFPVPNEIFLTILRTTNNVEELYATRSSIKKEIITLRSKDGGSCSSESCVKNQLSSLEYVDRMIDVRLNRLQEGSDRDSTGLPSSMDYSKLLSEYKLVQLSLNEVLKNGVALSYFIDHLSSNNLQIYIDAFYNIDDWKNKASRELEKLGALKNKNHIDYEVKSASLHNELRKSAESLYDQFLSEKCCQKLIDDVSAVTTLQFKIRCEIPHEQWFDEILGVLYDTLQNDKRFLPAFRTRPLYAKLLVELDLLKEPPLLKDTVADDEIGLADEQSTLIGECSQVGSPIKMTNKVSNDTPLNKELRLKQAVDDTIEAKIIETGVLQENGKTFGIYAIEVKKSNNDGHVVGTWHVYRRYSDFYELHQKIKEKYPTLAQIPFPAKKAFNNMDRVVLEKRMKMLNNYLQILLHQQQDESYDSLQTMLFAFLEPEYDKGGASGQFAKTFDNLVMNPLKVVGNAVKTMPDNLLNTVDGVVEGFSKVFTKSFRGEEDEEETMKVSSELDSETDNIPLRIMLLLMTEVFDLKTRNQWLRRRIITLVRQIMHAMFGDIVNRRILEYVAAITSPSRVALYLANIKNSIWPNSLRAEPMPSRDHDIRMQTRVAAKCALLASFSDDLKHILGSETSRIGLLLLFSMFQHQVLNKRLLYVLLEGFLVELCPNLKSFFEKLHSQSPRVIAKKKKNVAKI